MKEADSALPAPATVPVQLAEQPVGTAVQQAFRQAIQDVENLRERLRELRAGQADARRRYWQQVGPAAAAVVAARRSLFPSLEEALLLGYFSRLEEVQITEVILENARTLENRFGEDESAIIHKYAPVARRSGAETQAKNESTGKAASKATEEFIPAPPLPPHEQAAAQAKARRKTKARRAEETAAQAAQADQKQLESSTKTIYRQLARTHHPDLERDPEKQAHKTAQMQRITEAYEADDLFTLLQLLAESGPADAEADDVLARYTRALLQQQNQLKQEMNELKYGANAQRPAMGTGKKQELELRELKRHLRAEAEYVQRVSLHIANPDGLREILRQLASEGIETI